MTSSSNRAEHISHSSRRTRVARLSTPRDRKVLHCSVGTGEEQPLVPVVTPAHQEGRAAVVAVDLEDLRVPVGLARPGGP